MVDERDWFNILHMPKVPLSFIIVNEDSNTGMSFPRYVMNYLKITIGLCSDTLKGRF